MNRELYEIGVCYGYNARDTQSGDIFSAALEQARAVIRVSRLVAPVSAREELEIAYAFTLGYIDGYEGKAPIPTIAPLPPICSEQDNEIARRLLDW